MFDDDVTKLNDTQHALFTYIVIVKKLYVDLWESVVMMESNVHCIDGQLNANVNCF